MYVWSFTGLLYDLTVVSWAYLAEYIQAFISGSGFLAAFLSMLVAICLSRGPKRQKNSRKVSDSERWNFNWPTIYSLLSLPFFRSPIISFFMTYVGGFACWKFHWPAICSSTTYNGSIHPGILLTVRHLFYRKICQSRCSKEKHVTGFGAPKPENKPKTVPKQVSEALKKFLQI